MELTVRRYFDNIITINVGANLVGGNVERNTDVALNTWDDSTEIICPDVAPQRLRVVNSIQVVLVLIINGNIHLDNLLTGKI